MNKINKIVNLEVIKALKPCEDRLDNYIEYYGNKSFTKRQFMGLKNITHEDKLWVAFQSMPKEKVRLAAADIAELVLPIFEKQFPNDNRPRLAIEAARAAHSARVYAAANAAHSAYAAAHSARVYAAANAAYTAHSAHSAYAAAHAAAYAAAHSAHSAHSAYAAAYAAAHSAAHSANGDNKKQIRTIVLKYWK